MIPQKITDFYDKYKKMLYNTSLRITGDSFEAEEIMQDTVIKYLRNRKQEMSEEQVRVWLIRTCVRASIDMLRLRKGLKVKLESYAAENMEEDTQPQWDSLMASGGADELVRKIQKTLLMLPDGYRTVLSLLLFEGYDCSEAAQILNVAESTVRSQYLRGKRKLLQMLCNE